jgi:hypothetical protein
VRIPHLPLPVENERLHLLDGSGPTPCESEIGIRLEYQKSSSFQHSPHKS